MFLSLRRHGVQVSLSVSADGGFSLARSSIACSACRRAFSIAGHGDFLRGSGFPPLAASFAFASGVEAHVIVSLTVTS
jgi:hypothetical protein